jgi:predicted ATP-grasp superfamily ATP-dependent carboligase
MVNESVLVVGFNTRPLAFSLKNAGYEVYAVDFFGDLDLYPNVKDALILTKEFESNYNLLKNQYSMLFPKFTKMMLEKHREINYLIIGSGLDDAYEERENILDYIRDKNYKIKDLNNEVEAIKKSRKPLALYAFLKAHKIQVPFTISYNDLKFYSQDLKFPCILKKTLSAGGINVFIIRNSEDLVIVNKNLKEFNASEWIIQEYIEGTPISCTTISNGEECEIISINKQIIGEQIVNSPKDFMYCGNTVPANLSKKEEKLISKISKILSNELNLTGINGFDYVLKNHYPFLMEINPRIPGSIRASETSLGLNLLDLHIRSYIPNEWEQVKNLLRSSKHHQYSTKFIYFSPKEIDKSSIVKINQLEFIHDKSEPVRKIQQGEPVCTILTHAKNKIESYNKALQVVGQINKIIEE